MKQESVCHCLSMLWQDVAGTRVQCAVSSPRLLGINTLPHPSSGLKQHNFILPVRRPGGQSQGTTSVGSLVNLTDSVPCLPW